MLSKHLLVDAVRGVLARSIVPQWVVRAVSPSLNLVRNVESSADLIFIEVVYYIRSVNTWRNVRHHLSRLLHFVVIQEWGVISSGVVLSVSLDLIANLDHTEVILGIQKGNWVVSISVALSEDIISIHMLG
jgi:hypothetical protein